MGIRSLPKRRIYQGPSAKERIGLALTESVGSLLGNLIGLGVRAGTQKARQSDEQKFQTGLLDRSDAAAAAAAKAAQTQKESLNRARYNAMRLARSGGQAALDTIGGRATGREGGLPRKPEESLQTGSRTNRLADILEGRQGRPEGGPTLTAGGGLLGSTYAPKDPNMEKGKLPLFARDVGGMALTNLQRATGEGDEAAELARVAGRDTAQNLRSEYNLLAKHPQLDTRTNTLAEYLKPETIEARLGLLDNLRKERLSGIKQATDTLGVAQKFRGTGTKGLQSALQSEQAMNTPRGGSGRSKRAERWRDKEIEDESAMFKIDGDKNHLERIGDLNAGVTKKEYLEKWHHLSGAKAYETGAATRGAREEEKLSRTEIQEIAGRYFDEAQKAQQDSLKLKQMADKADKEATSVMTTIVGRKAAAERAMKYREEASQKKKEAEARYNEGLRWEESLRE